MQRRFDSIAGAGKNLDVRGLQQAFGIESMDAELAARLHAAVCRGAADGGATFDDVVIAKVSDGGRDRACMQVGFVTHHGGLCGLGRQTMAPRTGTC